jgi:membrane protein
MTLAARPQRRWHRLALVVLGRSALNFAEDRGTQMAAAISYYGLFSLFPLTLLAAAVFGIVLRSKGVQSRVLEQLFSQLPLRAADHGIVQQALANAASLGPKLTVVSLLAALWTAGALTAAIRSALNVIFRAPRRHSRFRDKLLDYALIPIIGLPFLSGVIVTAGWRIARSHLAPFRFAHQQLPWLLEQPAALLIPLMLSFGAFLLLYWLMPNRRISLVRRSPRRCSKD